MPYEQDNENHDVCQQKRLPCFHESLPNNRVDVLFLLVHVVKSLIVVADHQVGESFTHSAILENNVLENFVALGVVLARELDDQIVRFLLVRLLDDDVVDLDAAEQFHVQGDGCKRLDGVVSAILVGLIFTDMNKIVSNSVLQLLHRIFARRHD